MENEFLKDADSLASIIISAMANGWTTDLKIKYIRAVLPTHYNVKESKKAGSVHCVSKIGINDDEHWGYFMSALKTKFKDFLEVFHNVCYNHTDFTVYFKTT